MSGTTSGRKMGVKSRKFTLLSTNIPDTKRKASMIRVRRAEYKF